MFLNKIPKCLSTKANSVPCLFYHKNVDEALSLKNTVIAKELSLPPVKLHCSMLAEDAIKAALSDYRIKQQEKKKSEDQE
ncbi:hypothetical protein ACI65C_001523 [Semiaphis heraclei]